MAEKKKYNFIMLMINAMWIGIAMGIVILLVAAVNKRKTEACRRVDISITGVENNLFIDTDDVRNILERYNEHKLEGTIVDRFRLASMQQLLQKSNWVKTARLYFDNNNVLKVDIIEREPVARIFCANGSSFYLDTARFRLPLSTKFSARVPIVTNFPTDNVILSVQDSALLSSVRTLCAFISKDPFWMAQIEQIDITPDRTFELIPKLGQQVILFGDADNCRQKFNNLLLFYKQVESKVGWNKYSKINLKYQHQVIAEIRGAEQIKTDSVSTIQLMKVLVANALKQANDTIHNVQLLQPVEDNNILMQPSIDTAESKQINEITNIKSSSTKSNAAITTRSPIVKQNLVVLSKFNVTRSSPVLKHPIVKLKVNHITGKINKPVLKPVIKSKPITVNSSNDY